jgi:chitin disaccharide deacetylase
MAKLIVQADDLAITPATSLGIVHAINTGLVRATGIFTNRPDAADTAAQLADIEGVDIGLDLNMVTGAPLLPPQEVPGLVQPNGAFRTSHQIKAGFPIVSQDGFYLQFDPEPFDHDQTLAEARAQMRRFFDLFGRAPVYLHHHALSSGMLDQILHELGEEFGVMVMDDLPRDGIVHQVPNLWYTVPFGPAEQSASDPVAALLPVLEEVAEHEVSVLITHPGYVDAELLDISSFNVIRARDLGAVTSPVVKALLDERGIELATYTSCGLAAPSGQA